MFKVKNILIFFITIFFIYLPAGFAQNVTKTQKPSVAPKQGVQKSVDQATKKPKPGLTIMPAGINLGLVAFDKSVEATVSLKNTGTGAIRWSIQGPKSWDKVKSKAISGTLEKETDVLNVGVSLLGNDEFKDEKKAGHSLANVEMRIASGEEEIICTKKLPLGIHKEEIEINAADGPKKITLSFFIAYTQSAPRINLSTLRLDMGKILPNKTVSRKIILNNSGKETLTWSVEPPAHAREDMPDDFRQGRYLSFMNDEVKGTAQYSVPEPLKDTLELIGSWSETGGYPTSGPGDNLIKVNFTGTGILLYLSEHSREGKLTLALDKNPIARAALFEEQRKNGEEILIADQLEFGSHTLTITNKYEGLVVEGVKILGLNTAFFPAQSIKIFPASGATTLQTNYLTVLFNTGQAFPGFYEDYLVFKTNNGEAIVEMYAEVLPDVTSAIIDVYRYYNGNDYLFTSNPQAEINRLYQNKYTKEGIAFRLFQPGTPGTASFYRWYHPRKKCHFYHYDYNGHKQDLHGYILEGTLGNIATSKLTNTRELYRWYNAKTGHYFYSTELQGEKINKKAYRFDGIAGYVR